MRPCEGAPGGRPSWPPGRLTLQAGTGRDSSCHCIILPETPTVRAHSWLLHWRPPGKAPGDPWVPNPRPPGCRPFCWGRQGSQNFLFPGGGSCLALGLGLALALAPNPESDHLPGPGPGPGPARGPGPGPGPAPGPWPWPCPLTLTLALPLGLAKNALFWLVCYCGVALALPLALALALAWPCPWPPGPGSGPGSGFGLADQRGFVPWGRPVPVFPLTPLRQAKLSAHQFVYTPRPLPGAQPKLFCLLQLCAWSRTLRRSPT